MDLKLDNNKFRIAAQVFKSEILVNCKIQQCHLVAEKYSFTTNFFFFEAKRS